MRGIVDDHVSLCYYGATMLMIRLQRAGRTNVPVFRIVVTESQNSTKSGRYLEVLGSYNPRRDAEKTVDADRVKHWISKGAQVTDTLHNFFIDKKIIIGKKVNALPKKTVQKKEEPKKEEAKTAPAAATPESAPAAADTKSAPESVATAPVEAK